MTTVNGVIKEINYRNHSSEGSYGPTTRDLIMRLQIEMAGGGATVVEIYGLLPFRKGQEITLYYEKRTRGILKKREEEKLVRLETKRFSVYL